jgi:hypothetical protein
MMAVKVSEDGIADVSLQALSIHACKSLKILKCHGCGITSKGIDMLKEACKLSCVIRFFYLIVAPEWRFRIMMPHE